MRRGEGREVVEGAVGEDEEAEVLPEVPREEEEEAGGAVEEVERMVSCADSLICPAHMMLMWRQIIPLTGLGQHQSSHKVLR